MDITSVDIRPWLKDLMGILEEEFDGRNLFWINGNKGNKVNHGCSAILSRIMVALELLD